MGDARGRRGDQIFAFVLVHGSEVEREVRAVTLDDSGAEIINLSRIRGEAGEGGFVGESLPARLPAGA